MSGSIKKIVIVFISVVVILFISPLFIAIDVDAEADEKNIIDFHAHVAGLGYGSSGCFINKEMRENMFSIVFIGDGS